MTGTSNPSGPEGPYTGHLMPFAIPAGPDDPHRAAMEADDPGELSARTLYEPDSDDAGEGTPARRYCTNATHADGEHNQSCMPPADPADPELRLLRAIFGLCADCDRTDEHEHGDPGDEAAAAIVREAIDSGTPVIVTGNEGCPHFRNPDDCEQCERDREHGRRIVATVNALNGNVAEALKAISRAQRRLNELTGGDAWDIELAEGTEGWDAADELKSAARRLRHVQRIVAARKRYLDEEIGHG